MDKSEIKKDLFGNIPKIGDIIIYNPAKYKGLVYGICVGFSKHSNLPIVLIDDIFRHQYLGNTIGENYKYTPKTGFIIK